MNSSSTNEGRSRHLQMVRSWPAARVVVGGWALWVVWALLGAAPASGEDASVGVFHAASPSSGFFQQDGPGLIGAGQLEAGATLDVGSSLLVARDPKSGEPVMDGVLLSSRAALHLIGGYGVTSRLELGVALAAAMQTGDSSPYRAELRRFAVSDVRLRGKLALAARGPWRSALALELSLPSALDRSFFGDAGVTTTALVIGGLDRGRLSLSGQAGYRLRRSAVIEDLQIDDEVLAGVAGRYAVRRDKLWLQAELYGVAGVQAKGNELERPVEAMAGARLALGSSWLVQAGVGLGMTRGYGAAEARGIFSLARVPGRPAPRPVARAWVPPEDDEPTFPTADAAPDASEPAAPPQLTVIGDRIVLPASVLFDVGGDALSADGREVLRRILQLWRESPTWTAMAIEGHTDVRGSTAANQALSERRAANVRRALIELGADAAAVTSVGFGESRPAARGSSDADHAANRRVEFVITRRQVEVP